MPPGKKMLDVFVKSGRTPRVLRRIEVSKVADTTTIELGADLGGEVGHAAVCNMDYYWPPAFNKSFKMERDKTLLQGHDHCNHRYLDTSTA